jgi:hypothetical protein
MIVCLTKIWNPIIHPHIATKKVIGSNVFDPTTGHVLENVFLQDWISCLTDHLSRTNHDLRASLKFDGPYPYTRLP